MTNLRILVQETGSQAKLCRRTDTDQIYLSQLITGVKTKSGAVRGIGDKLARKLEAGMSKPRGWMDVLHVPDLDPNVLALARAIESLSPDARGHLQAVTDSFVKSQALEDWNGVERRRGGQKR